MIDTSNLTLVQALTLNAYYYMQKYRRLEDYICVDNVLRRSCDFDIIDMQVRLFGIIDISVNSEYNKSALKFIKHPNWINERYYMNCCKKMAWPEVKSKGYTRSQALAEAREVIEWVKRRYEEAI